MPNNSSLIGKVFRIQYNSGTIYTNIVVRDRTRTTELRVLCVDPVVRLQHLSPFPDEEGRYKRLLTHPDLLNNTLRVIKWYKL